MTRPDARSLGPIRVPSPRLRAPALRPSLEVEVLPDVAAVAEVTRSLRRSVLAPLPAWHNPPLFLELDRFSPRTSHWRRHRGRHLACFDSRGEVRGRLTVFLPRAGGEGRFGAFLCRPDPRAARALLRAGEDWLRAQGATRVQGPLFFSMHEEVGVLTHGFDRPPAVMMPYDPPWTIELLEDAGYQAIRRFHTLRYRLEVSLEETTAVAADGDGFRVRSFDKARLDDEVDALRSIYNRAFAGNWGFHPISKRACKAMVEEMLLVGDPLLIRIAVHQDSDRPVGFLLCLPDIHHFFHRVRGAPGWAKLPLLIGAKLTGQLKECRVVTLAVDPDFQGRGLSRRLISSLAGEAAQVGYGGAELSYIDAKNRQMEGLMGDFDFDAGKSYALLERPLR